MASNAPKSSPLATVRRDQANIDPLAYSSGPSTPQQQHNRTLTPKGHMESAPFQKLLTPAEILDTELKVFIGQCRKQALAVEEVQLTLEGLLTFAATSSWQGVATLSSKLLFEEENLPEQHLSLITGLRFEALYRMKQYDELATEAASILAEEESRLAAEGESERFNYNTTVSMRLLLNDVKIMTGRSEEALQQLLAMHKWLASLPQESIVTFWLWQVKCHVVNGYIRLRNWKAATLEMNRMLNDLQSLVQGCSNVETKTDLVKAQIVLLTRLARLLFQIGSVKNGSLYYEKASALLASDVNVAKDEALQSQVLLTQGLLLFSTEQFEQALDLFTTIIDTEGGLASEGLASQLAPSIPASVLKGATAGTLEAAVASALSVHDLQRRAQADGSNLAVAVNNLSICALYVKQIRTAITRLEQLILLDPARHLTDPVVFNLCTLYDLSYAPDTSVMKKKVMQGVAGAYHVDDPILHWRSFRLS